MLPESLEDIGKNLDQCTAHALSNGVKSHTFTKPLRARLWCSLAVAAERHGATELAVRGATLVLALVAAVSKGASGGELRVTDTVHIV